MPIYTNPNAETIMPPSVYRIYGVSMHNVAEPIRQEPQQSFDPDHGFIDGLADVIVGYMIVEWEAGDLDAAGAFVRRATGRATIDGDAFRAYLDDATGAAIAALLKLYLHQAMVEASVFPAGQNAVTEAEYGAISSFCGRWLANL